MHRPVKAVEILILECADDLPHPVRAEVEEDQRIAVFDPPQVGSLGRQHRDRLHELVGHALLVKPPYRLQRLLRLRADTERHQVVTALHALPSLVAVHREIAADDGGEMRARAEQLAQVLLGRLRRRVAAVEDGMDEDSLRAERVRRVDQLVQMRLQRVHAAIGQQPHEMHPPPAYRLGQHLVLRQIGVADAHDVLIDHASRADVQVPDLGIAHLSVRQSDRGARRVERRPRHLA